MSKSKTAVIPGDGNDTLTPLQCAMVTADAMYRAALDTWHHHERGSRLVGQPTIEMEHRVAREMCALCDEALGDMVAAYELAAAGLQPEGADGEAWHKANALWHASREYLRRHAGCDRLTRRIGAHSPGELGAMVVEFDLEASAVLALRHAAEAYRRTRPDLTAH